MFADTHCHLDFDVFHGRLTDILSGMEDRRLGFVVVPTVSVMNFGAVETLCKIDKRLLMGLGLHPYYIKEHKISDLDVLEKSLKRLRSSSDSGLVALGEIGLDGACVDMPRQVELFEAQLKLAEKYRLPVMIHSRKCNEQMFRILSQYRLVGGVIHAFSGSYELMMRFVNLGFKIGVGPVITWERATKTIDAIARAPLSVLVLETDAPGMRVAGREEKDTSPFDVLDVFEVVSAIRPECVVELESALWEESKRLFGLAMA